MSDDNKEIAVARVSKTGALIPLNNKNRGILSQPGVVETTAKKDKEGKYVEVGGADRAEVIAASMDLQRIGDALSDNKAAREKLLTAALKLPKAAEYLQSLGVYKGEDDEQYIDPDSLQANNAGLPEQEVDIVSVTKTPPVPAKTKNEPKHDNAKPKKTSSSPDEKELADL